MTRGKFITLEGGEGVGKSTLQRGLIQKLELLGLVVVSTREPGGTPGAEAVRELILDHGAVSDWSPLSQLFLFNAARRDHIEKVIEPALRSGGWVVCDRFYDSTAAYQTVDGALSAQTVNELTDLCIDKTKPDLTIILDLDPQQAENRRLKRQGPSDVFERKPRDFHAKIRQAFLDISERESDRCVVLDAALPPDTVINQSFSMIQERFLND